MHGERPVVGTSRLAALVAALAVALGAPPAAPAEGAVSVEPKQILAGSFYDGATIDVRGTVDEGSQVAIRVTGPLEHHRFNRRGRIGGIIWGGIEHVSFRDAPTLYAVYTSAALGAMAPPPLRDRLRLGYETLASHIAVEGQRADAKELVEQLVRLKESEGLYREAPGAVRLADAAGGRRAFDVAVPVPAGAAPGVIEVTVLELAGGAVVRAETTPVVLERVGMPARLFRVAHEQSALFGLIAVMALLVTGVGVDVLGSRRAARTHPAVVMLVGMARGLDEAVLAPRRLPRSPEDVRRLHARYRLFRTLLSLNNEVLESLTELEDESSWTSFRHPRVRMGIRALFDGTADMVAVLNELTGRRYFDLANVVAALRSDVFALLEKDSEREHSRLALSMSEIGSRTAAGAGDKAATLARIQCDLGLRVPDSFVLTTDAYRELLESGGLAGQLRTILAPARLDAPEELRRLCEMARDLVRGARLPASVSGAIREAYAASGFPPGDGLAVRSSATGEGSDLSFAGQFESFLNVPPADLADAWKSVVASRFSPGAVFYRRAAGVAEVDTPMAVLVQRMVRARASGVLYTRRPGEPGGSELLVTAVRGLGPDVSSGVAVADELAVSRAAPHEVVERRIARKAAVLASAAGGGLVRAAVSEPEQMLPAITDAEAARLAETALAIERYFGKPQDIEWALDERGQLLVLQARPLRVERTEDDRGGPSPDAPVLLRGGEPVWLGRAVGPVHVARTAAEEEATPAGAILVVPRLLPDRVRILPRVSGIVVEQGTVTGHTASILREFHIPSLFGARGALEALAPGRLASLDVASRTVFDGVLWPELRGRLPVTVLGGRTAGLPDLLAGKLTKLSGSAFVGTWACQSLHDVVRFAHEMAIQAMFDLGDRLLESPVGGVKTIDCPPPLYVHVVDLGGGIRPEAADAPRIDPRDVVSAPFQGLWRGLGDRHFAAQRPAADGGPLETFLAVRMVESAEAELGPPNYACITDTYLNLNTRAGVERDPLRARPRRQAYHYIVVDSFLSENPNENHVSLRLRGGGGDGWQRSLRARLAAEILRRRGLTVSVTGDLLNAWVRGVDRATGASELAAIGHLLRFLTRLDLAMSDERDVGYFVDAFAAAETAARAVTMLETGARTA